MFIVIYWLVEASAVLSVSINQLNCGQDLDPETPTGDVPVHSYPWLGMLFYFEYKLSISTCCTFILLEVGASSDTSAATAVVLIHEEFVLGSAADIAPMPRDSFRLNGRVLMGSDVAPGRRVRDLVVHPEYGETLNTLVIVQLMDRVNSDANPTICPPARRVSLVDMHVIRLKDDITRLQKEVVPVCHLLGNICKDFYVAANLYEKKMRPAHVVCAVSLLDNQTCVWETGAVLANRDEWGRWQMLGFGVRGPGCGAPSRFLDMVSYFPWVQDTLTKFDRLLITKVNDHKYVLRSVAYPSYATHGACTPEEKRNLLYRDALVVSTSNLLAKEMRYNLSITQSIDITCMTMEVQNASATTELSVTHSCIRQKNPVLRPETECFFYRNSKFEVYVHLKTEVGCLFEMLIWGDRRNSTLLDRRDWHWEEGTYYEQYVPERTEYRGPMSGFGYEPLDGSSWVPDYDLWTTTTTVAPGALGTTDVPRRDGSRRDMDNPSQ